MKAFKGYLESHFPPETANLHIQTVTDEQATRANIIQGFTDFLSQANGENEDLAIFYYSGHGAQSPAPKELKEEDPQGLMQSIVCWDSRIENGIDLVDKELGYLISKVSGKVNQKPPHFLLVMDCCHSGSGTRSTDATQTKSRQMEVATLKRPLNALLGYDDRLEKDGKISFPTGKHILLAAAASHQTAKETRIEGTQRGVFTYSLIKALMDAKKKLSYQELIQLIHTSVYNLVQDQTLNLKALAISP